MIVVDASVVVHVLAVEPADGPVRALLTGQDELHAPHLLDLEVTSAVRALAARGRLGAAAATACLADLRDLPLLRYPHHALLRRVWALRDNMTVYDAAYVALAEELDAILFTGDRALATALGVRCEIELVGH